MRQIFVSYIREHEKEVRALCADLDKLGHGFWVDQKLSGGQDWWDGILRQIRECDVFLLALGTTTLDSTACKSERDYALKLGKPILPVIVGAGVSVNLLPAELSRIQLVDYRSTDRDAVMGLSRAIAGLPEPAALPDPLPETPPVPLSYVGGLSERIGTPAALDEAEQHRLLSELRAARRDAHHAQDARVLLEKLRSRRDLLASIALEIDEILETRPLSASVKDGTATQPGTPADSRLGRRIGVVVAASAVLAAAAAYLYYMPSPESVEASVAAAESAEPAGAAPASAEGATISGTVIYAGRPVVEFSNAPAVIELLDTSTRARIQANVTYDETSGRFQIENVPSGQFTPFVRIESGYPFDRESGGDFYSRLSSLNEAIAVPPNTQTIERDLKVVKVIRLKRPLDNQELRTSTGDPPERLSVRLYAPTAERFEWDPVPRAASYELRFLRMQGNQRVDSMIRSTTGTSFEPGLGVTPAGQHYQFSITANDADGNLVGNYVHYFRNGSGGWFEFVVVDGPP